MERIAEYLTPQAAAERLVQLATEMGSSEVAAVRNIGTIPASHELYVLAPSTPLPLRRICAFAVDMDGTSTTTEPLALHALEFMVRRITNRLSCSEWAGLDAVRDVPFVIGNSNYRHTEFLLERYREHIEPTAFRRSVMEAWVWTLLHMEDRQRRAEVMRNMRTCGAEVVLRDGELRAARSDALDAAARAALVARLATGYADYVRPPHFHAEVAAALDVYYHRYHELLQRIARGEGDRLAHELLGAGKHLIAPMPGYGVFVALVRGWLYEEEAAALAPVLRAAHPRAPQPRPDDARVLRVLARYFRQQPAKLALVTASIAYEAHVSMQEVLRVLRQEIAAWPLPAARRDELCAQFSDCANVFDAFVTASEAWEARLKPHRDLYSLALYHMGVPRDAYAQCVAIEDTEPGIIAARAAGFGVAVALPNYDTARQNYEKASRVVHGGLPELILAYRLFLRTEDVA